jgi:Xaa-Pro aminopeptidase
LRTLHIQRTLALHSAILFRSQPLARDGKPRRSLRDETGSTQRKETSGMWQRPEKPDVEPRLLAIMEQPYPSFSAAEMSRRRALVEALMKESDVGHLVVYGAFNAGSAVPWITGWPVTVEAVVIVTPGEKDALYVQYYNHLPLARRVAREAEVHWVGAQTSRTVADALKRRGAQSRRVGVIGPLGFAARDTIADACKEVVDLNRGYARLRRVKSAEELDWFRLGAALSDLSIHALQRELRPGLTERDLGDIIERAYVPHGARNVIHFIGLTSMAAPDICVPAQYPSPRAVARGDVMFTEISCDFWGYGGQVLRTFSIGEKPTPLYRDLHNAAMGAFDAICKVLRPGAHASEIVEAASVIEDAGFTTYDDLVHGYGGGYWPPVLGSKSRPNEPVPDLRLEEGMMLVVQPNVITKDERAGVQTGECMVVTKSGCESLHRAPRGFLHVET